MLNVIFIGIVYKNKFILYTMKSVPIKEKLTAPYAINPMLCKNPCFETTHFR